MKLLWNLMLLLIVGLQFRLWVGEGSFAEARMLEQNIAQQQAANALLLERNARLDAEVQDLKRGYEAIEERARMELGMIKPDETFFLVVSSHN